MGGKLFVASLCSLMNRPSALCHATSLQCRRFSMPGVYQRSCRASPIKMKGNSWSCSTGALRSCENELPPGLTYPLSWTSVTSASSVPILPVLPFPPILPILSVSSTRQRVRATLEP